MGINFFILDKSSLLYSCERPVTSIACIHAKDYKLSLTVPQPVIHNLEYSSLKTFAIVLAILAVLSCSVNFGICLVYLQSKGILSCDIFGWLLDKPTIENTHDDTNLPLDPELIVEESDSMPLVSSSRDYSMQEMQVLDDYESDDEITLTRSYSKPKYAPSSPPQIESLKRELSKPVEYVTQDPFRNIDYDDELDEIEKQLAKVSGLK